MDKRVWIVAIGLKIMPAVAGIIFSSI